jgi:hypothetical protein
MSQRDSKSKRKSVKASKTRSRTPAQLKKDAARLFEILHSAEVSDKIRYEIDVLLLEHYDPAVTVHNHKELFVQCYVIAAKESGDERQQKELERILNQLDAGKSLESIVKMRETGQPQRPRPFASLARHLSGVLNDPQTPDGVYNALADQVTDLCNPYFQATHESAEFIEEALIFNARGTATPVPHSTPAKDETRVLAEHIAAIIASPNAPDDVVDGLIRGMQETNTDANVHADANYVEAILRRRLSETKGGASDVK